MPPRSPTNLAIESHIATLAVNTRTARSDRDAESAHEDDGKATVELATIMATTSNPVSPGPSSPPLDQGRMQDFVPPTRPSSTPFPQPEPRNSDIRRIRCAADSPENAGAESVPMPATPVVPAYSYLNQLPAEIHECVLDHLFGYRVSTTSKSSLGMHSVTRSWGTALRHSRRKELSQLALVSGTWRDLIQNRLYRHIKLKATVESLSEATRFFSEKPHLRPHVRHVEIWFPVFQPKSVPVIPGPGEVGASYVLPGDNCSLEEAFYFVTSTLPGVRVLTLEGGERKKAPKVRHYISQRTQHRDMPVVGSVRTLVCKGQWNLIRNDEDFGVIQSALPNLEEWHGSYAKPKSKSYLSMATILPKLPTNLTSLHLCLEADYRRELVFPPYAMKVANKVHFCTRLAEAAPALEHLSYTGRVCRTFFDLTSRLVDPRSTRLKSIDITVKNCCRHVLHWQESGSGITDMNFINAFESLVVAGIRSLARLKALEYLRIRFVDLDSPVPPLNPYFMLRDGWCSGVWSDAIIAELNRSRPTARFEELAESFGEVGYNKDGRMVISPDFPRSRVLSLKLANYALLSGGIAIS